MLEYIFLGILAIVPTIFLIIYIYYKDSYEKEPVSLLIQLFLLGVVSIIPAMIIEEIGDLFYGALFGEGNFLYNFADAFLVVALAEEGGKFFFTYIRTWKNKEFNYKFDGIVYCVLTSLGFATVENILYVLEGGLSTAIARALLSVPSHAIDAVFMGYFYGKAKYDESLGNKSGRNHNLILAYLSALILHGIYDFCLFMETDLSIIIFVMFVIAIDISAVIRIHYSSKNNMKIYRKNYTNVMGNVYVPNAHLQYYNMYGANYGQQLQNQRYNGYGSAGYGTNNNYSAGNYNTSNRLNNGFGVNNNRMYIYCSNCGNLCNIKTFYCSKCGAPIRRNMI